MGRHKTKLGEPSRAQTRPPLPYPVSDGRIPPTVQAVMDRRTQRRKSRLAAISAAGMLAVGGAAGVSMATADESGSSSDDQIVFSGNCGTLDVVSASSKPDSTEVTVPVGSEVSYRNELGTDAQLHVGDEIYDIDPDSEQVFVMNRSAEVAMVPNCHGLFADYDAAQVRVAEAQSDDDAPENQEPASGEAPASDSDGEGSEQTNESEPDSAAGDGAAAGRGEGPGSNPEERPEGSDAAGTDEDSKSDEGKEVNSFGETGTDSGTDSSGSGAPNGEEVVAVDPKAVTDGANGLLALIAIVCLVGVSAAVMRTMLKFRAAA
ncbi:hypothetical protein [Glycomyces buryatensis]|uniref:Uncharacterized protein n=1 Tax=Glycomyces buryatensis TaxID=2570927 RepID=A0A4V4HS75_9ACTN|nr:hypothetical protein [Glycomyces buryatensis]THV40656.1 hypothetical protein FAB82_15475 [Glycomyces buryatensis]